MSENISRALIQKVPSAVAWKYRIIPVKESDGTIYFVGESGDDEQMINYLEVLFDQRVAVQEESKELIDEYLNSYYLKSKTTNRQSFNEDSDDFILKVIEEANDLNSSDIHIERYQEKCRIRMRLDGKLVERYELSSSRYSEYINKIKILANLDIAEKRLPQDGRILIREQDLQFDIRVSILPTMFGEKVVLRLLSNDAEKLSINDLGLNVEQLAQFKKVIAKPQGIILISGPTGSGKTTTLYATLKELNNVETNVLTIEDPIEYTLAGINQVQLNANIGLDFSRALRTFLRQDPDVIMVGEIRDVETAQIAIRAAMTGHMVMSTVHTNSAYGIITRLIEMGIPGYLLADTLNMAVAQRLVRLLCPHCKKRVADISTLPPELRSADTEYYRHEGCVECYNTGYRGRKAIYELLPMSDKLRSAILSGDANFVPEELVTLKQSALNLFKQGRTTLEEIYSYLV